MSSPTYHEGLLPGTAVWVPVCDSCGALVLHQWAHAEWHARVDATTESIR